MFVLAASIISVARVLKRGVKHLMSLLSLENTERGEIKRKSSPCQKSDSQVSQFRSAMPFTLCKEKQRPRSHLKETATELKPLGQSMHHYRRQPTCQSKLSKLCNFAITSCPNCAILSIQVVKIVQNCQSKVCTTTQRQSLYFAQLDWSSKMKQLALSW